MSLAGIRYLQDRDDRSNFDWSHFIEHQNIAQAIKSVLGITVPVMPLHPVGDMRGWALQHQAMHDDMHRACATAGKDLTDDAFSPEWIDQNFQEHLAVKTVLGI